MKFFLKKLPLLVATLLLPLSAHAHLIGDHTSEAAHSAIGFEHVVVAALAAGVGYGIYKKLS